MATTDTNIGWGLALGGLLASSGIRKSLFGGGNSGSGPSYYDLMNERNNEMNMFTQQLAQSRSGFISAMNGMNQQVMSQFAPNTEAQFAGRGLNVTGGAYQAALARQSATLAAQGNVMGAQMGQNDIQSVMGFAGNPMALGNPYGEANQQQQLAAQRYNSQGMGRLVGAGLTMAGMAMGGPAGGAIGSAAGSSLGSLFNRSAVGNGYQGNPSGNGGYGYPQGMGF